MIFRKAHPCLLQPYTIILIETCEWPAILSAALKCNKKAHPPATILLRKTLLGCFSGDARLAYFQ
jgi:hypothetical protein